MATDAFPLFKRCVHHRLVQSDFLFVMAVIAHLITCFFEKQLWNYTVPEVAIFTFLLLNNRVYIFHGEICLRKLRVALQAILTYELSALGRGGTGRKINDPAYEKEHAGFKTDAVSVE
jgi:hypothetical protein